MRKFMGANAQGQPQAQLSKSGRTESHGRFSEIPFHGWSFLFAGA